MFFFFSSGGAQKTLDVGVVLDTNSLIGNIGWSCMQWAVEDFYTAHPNYTTKLSLYLRESGEDAFGAASAALDLLQNVRVQAIIGPQKSAQAKFVIQLGNKIQVPIISFSVQSPSLSSVQNPYFIRTSINASGQAGVIGSIVREFKWKRVVPIFEDSEYGAGIMPYLVDALQDIGARVTYRSTIPLSATKKQLSKELNKLNNTETRVFVVHMSCSLGLQLFKMAKEMGMLRQGYVWITTYGLTDVVDLKGSEATSVMQGVLGIKPYVKGTKKLDAFKKRWKSKFYKPETEFNVTEPTVFGLWAYDTVWSLALAAESVRATNFTFREQKIANSSSDLATVGISQSGPQLLNLMEKTIFDGISGRFHLIDGQLELQAFEIFNVVAHGKKRVGFWTPKYGTSKYTRSKADLDAIKWPGNPTKLPPRGWEWPTRGKNLTVGVPRGWEWPTRGKNLTVGVPVKHGFPNFLYTENGSNGFCIQVFESVIRALPYHVGIEYHNFTGTYDDLVYDVYLQKFDAAVGDITIIANRSSYVDFTLPFFGSGVSTVVPVTDERSNGGWSFTEPLTSNLWFASFAFFVFTGFVVWVLEHRINEEFRGTPTNQLGTTFYFTFSTLVFAHREVVSNLSRIVVIIWVFVVLILTQSYTATLTSILTAQKLLPTVTDLNYLLQNGSSVGYQVNTFTLDLLMGMKFNRSKLVPLSSPQDYYDALSNGTVAAVVDEIPYLKVFLSQYCNFAMVGQTYKSDGFGFAFPRGSPLVPDVSRSILQLNNSYLDDLAEKLYANKTCPDITTTSNNSLSFKSFWGLFLITGVTSILAILVHLVFFLYEHRDKLRSHDILENTVSQKLALLVKLYNQRSKIPRAPEEKDEDRVSGDIMATPDIVSGVQSPSAMSSYKNSNYAPDDEIGSPLEGEATPGREISAQNLDTPSFANMV